MLLDFRALDFLPLADLERDRLVFLPLADLERDRLVFLPLADLERDRLVFLPLGDFERDRDFLVFDPCFTKRPLESLLREPEREREDLRLDDERLRLGDLLADVERDLERERDLLRLVEDLLLGERVLPFEPLTRERLIGELVGEISLDKGLPSAVLSNAYLEFVLILQFIIGEIF